MSSFNQEVQHSLLLDIVSWKSVSLHFLVLFSSMLPSIASRLSPGGEKGDHRQLQADFPPAEKPLEKERSLCFSFCSPCFSLACPSSHSHTLRGQGNDLASDMPPLFQ